MYQNAAASSAPLADSILLHPGFYFAFLGLLAVFYALKSIGLSTMARNRNIAVFWLGWVPVADMYILGRLCGSFSFYGIRIYKSSVLLPLGLMIVILSGYIPILGIVASIIYFLFCCAALYRLFSIYSPENALWYLLLSILMLCPVMLYLIRNNQPQSTYDSFAG